jgi:BirA family biotin operon repressor/biotin-[acetyl-CoA-carboxylase] ligase
VSRLVSLAICDVLEDLGVENHIKWPNDILSRRGKIAGILIEHSITAGNISHSIVGIGLNLNQIDFPDFSVPATSLRLESGKFSDIILLGEQLEDRLQSRYHSLKEGKTARLEQEYLEKLFKAGIPVLFEYQGGSFEGVIRGVNDFGELQVERDGEVRTYAHGSIDMKLEFDPS